MVLTVVNETACTVQSGAHPRAGRASREPPRAAPPPRTRRFRAVNTTQSFSDPHAQLRALYMSLLKRQENFDEFKQLLALYEVPPEHAGEEPLDACAVRSRLNARIRSWIGGPFEGLSAAQVLQWRAIVVEERLNVSLSPWKESNLY
jgi:hypothetical protein